MTEKKRHAIQQAIDTLRASAIECPDVPYARKLRRAVSTLQKAFQEVRQAHAAKTAHRR